MFVSEEIFEGFFSKSVDDNKIPKSLIDILQDYYNKGEEPTREAIIELISGAAQDAA